MKNVGYWMFYVFGSCFRMLVVILVSDYILIYKRLTLHWTHFLHLGPFLFVYFVFPFSLSLSKHCRIWCKPVSGPTTPDSPLPRTPHLTPQTNYHDGQKQCQESIQTAAIVPNQRTNFSASIWLAPWMMKAWMRRTSGGMLPGRSHRTGARRWGNSAMYVSGTPVLCTSISSDRIWKTYGINSATKKIREIKERKQPSSPGNSNHECIAVSWQTVTIQ